MRTILLFVFSSLSIGSFAQLDFSRQQIVLDRGNDYTSGVSDAGGSYICYDGSAPTAPLLLTTCFHFEKDNDKCYLVKKMYVASYANDLIKMFKKSLVQLEPMAFRDYETNTNFFVYVKEGILIVDMMRGE